MQRRRIIKVKDKSFTVTISERAIKRQIKRIADQINRDYEGTNTTGSVREVIGLNVDITGRPVIIVEDIVDTGLTMAHMLDTLKKQNPESIDICTLLLKPSKLQVKLDIRYCCKQIPDDFVVGYGLDYDGFGRNTKDIYTII